MNRSIVAGIPDDQIAEAIAYMRSRQVALATRLLGERMSSRGVSGTGACNRDQFGDGLDFHFIRGDGAHYSVLCGGQMTRHRTTEQVVDVAVAELLSGFERLDAVPGARE